MNLDALRKQIQSMQHLIGTRPSGLYVTPAIRDDNPVHWVVQVDDNHNEWLVLETEDEATATVFVQGAKMTRMKPEEVLNLGLEMQQEAT